MWRDGGARRTVVVAVVGKRLVGRLVDLSDDVAIRADYVTETCMRSINWKSSVYRPTCYKNSVYFVLALK